MGSNGWVERLAWSLCATCVVLTAIGVGFLALNGGVTPANTLTAIGWLLLAAGLGLALQARRSPPSGSSSSPSWRS